MVNLFFKARACNRSRSSGGFTLVEMLTVVTIIVLLVSLLLPSVENVANLAYRSSCFHNMYKIGQLNQEYSNANNGYVVPALCSARDPNIAAGNNPYVAVSFDECLREINTGTAYRTQTGANLYQCPAGPAGWLEIGDKYPAAGASPPLHPHDPDPPSSPTDGGSYVMNIHQNQNNGSTWDGASWEPAPNGIVLGGTTVGLKTSQWDDASGTIFLFETWRAGGWQNPISAQDVNWAGGPMQAAMGAGDHSQAISIWQEKHLGKANLLFCDGHGESMHMSDTIKTQGITYTTAPTMDSCNSVRGMWTHAAGD